jgi:hypothetical protein
MRLSFVSPSGRKWQLEFVKQDNLFLPTLGAEGTWQQRFSF